MYSVVFFDALRVKIRDEGVVRSFGTSSRRATDFPSDEATLKPIWLARRDVVAKWPDSRRDWKSATTRFALLFPGTIHHWSLNLDPPRTRNSGYLQVRQRVRFLVSC